MRSNQRDWLLHGALAAMVGLAGCGSAQREATEAAVNAAQRAVSAVQDATEKYAPDQLKGAQDALKSAKDELAKSDYQGALNSAKAAAERAKEAISTAAAKKDEWNKEWKDLNVAVPRALNEAKDKLDAYTKHGKLPPGVTKDQMSEAQAQYDKLKDGWTEVSAAYQRGELFEAMKKASWLQESLQKLKDLLGMK